MAVVEFTPDERQGGLKDGFKLPRGTALRARLPRNDATCEYRTAHDVMLWPIEIKAPDHHAGERRHRGEVPRPHHEGRAHAPAADDQRGALRAHPNRRPRAVLSRDRRGHLAPVRARGQAAAIGVAARDSKSGSWVRIEGARVEPYGTEDDAALLPVGPRAFQGYRLLHEYFAFPERFLFAHLRGLSRGIRECKGNEIELLVALDRADSSLEPVVTPSNVSLFSTPAVNLFPKRADRIQLSDADSEYHLVPDRAHPHGLRGPHGDERDGVRRKRRRRA